MTGAAGGTGKATALRFADEGGAAVIADVQDDKATAVARAITDAGGKALAIHLDVRVEDQWKDAVAKSVETFGGLDVLVNNASIGGAQVPVEATSYDDYRKTISITQDSVFLCMKYTSEELKGPATGQWSTSARSSD